MESLEYVFLEDMNYTGRFVLSLGQKGSGKSYTLLSFLKYALFYEIYEKLHLILPMYKYEQNNQYDFLKTQKQCMVYNGYSEQVSKIVDKDRLKYKTLFIIDDASAELLQHFDSTFLKLITTARHGKGLTIWCCVHSCKRILAPMIRQNVDYLFIYRLSNRKLLIDIYDEFCSLIFETFNEFKQFYDQVMTEKNNALFFSIFCYELDGNVKNWIINTTKDNYTLKSHASNKNDDKKKTNEHTYKNKHKISTRIISKFR